MVKLNAEIFKDSKSGRVFLAIRDRIYVEAVLRMKSGREIAETYQEIIKKLNSGPTRISLSTNEDITCWYKIDAEKFKKSFIHFFLTYQEPVSKISNNMHVYELEPIILEDKNIWIGQ